MIYYALPWGYEHMGRRHPDWLKAPLPGGKTHNQLKQQLRKAKLHTICEEAKCPNLAECFGNGTATFLIMGNTCTRNCQYCHVAHGKPQELDPKEPDHVAESVFNLGLNYVVITSVTRDDLSDGGSDFFYQTIQAIKTKNPGVNTEVLIPDFNGDSKDLQHVLSAEPTVLNHNIEVVKPFFPQLRPQGDYQRSLQVLATSKKLSPTITTKSGLMIGFGETKEQIETVLDDLRAVNVDFLTIGQYLQPSSAHVPVKKYYTPEEFNSLKQMAIKKGFNHVESGPLVRSSYHAEQSIQDLRK